MGKSGGTDQSLAPLKSTVPPENTASWTRLTSDIPAVVKLTSPPENLAPSVVEVE
jgi:hypothetical protein